MARFDVNSGVREAHGNEDVARQDTAAARARKRRRLDLAQDLTVQRETRQADRALDDPDPFAKSGAKKRALNEGVKLRDQSHVAALAVGDVTAVGLRRAGHRVFRRKTARALGHGALFGLGVAYQPVRGGDKLLRKALGFMGRHKSFWPLYVFVGLSFAPYLVPALAIIALPHLARGAGKASVWGVHKVAARSGRDTQGFDRLVAKANDTWAKVERPLAAGNEIRETREQIKAVLASAPQGLPDLPHETDPRLKPNHWPLISATWEARNKDAREQTLTIPRRQQELEGAFERLVTKLEEDRGLKRSDAKKTLQAMFGTDVGAAIRHIPLGERDQRGRVVSDEQRTDEKEMLAVLDWMNTQDLRPGINSGMAANIAVGRRSVNGGPLTPEQSEVLAVAGGYGPGDRMRVGSIVKALPRDGTSRADIGASIASMPSTAATAHLPPPPVPVTRGPAASTATLSSGSIAL